jgi:hypothetical protein
VDFLVPKLAQFYDEVIAAIRKIDKVHLLSLEGHHWSTETTVFWKKYDDNVVIHFHRYGCPPDIAVYKNFIDLRDQLDEPLWLGETGENNNQWYAALFTIAFNLGIGINVWPWKKMQCFNSPLSVKKPNGWDALQYFIQGEGPKPSKKEAISMFDEYLSNMKIENCNENTKVNAAIFRRPPLTLRGADFDPLPGKGISYSGTRDETSFFYQAGTGMAIRIEEGQNFMDNNGWARWGIFSVELCAGEFAVYSIHQPTEGTKLSLGLNVLENGNIIAIQDEKPLGSIPVKTGEEAVFSLHAGIESKIKIQVESGRFVLNSLKFW